MGRGEIIGGGAGGLYSLRLKLDRTRAEELVAGYVAKLASLNDEQIPPVAAELALATAALATAESDLGVVIGQYRATPPTATLAGVQAATAAVNSSRQDLAAHQVKYNALAARVTAIGQAKKYLADKIALGDPTVSAWCADLTEDLAGEVGTIEIPGERNGTPVLIRPGYGGAGAYNAARDGQLQPSFSGTPASVFYNLALLPGWQKWRPTFRLGAITAKAGELCSVAIDPAGSSVMSLNINQDTADGLVTLTDVPFDYMTCHGVAFSVGDRVVVKFTDQDWTKPVVIGFEENPQPCARGVLVLTVTGVYYESTNPLLANPQPAVNDLYLVWNSALDSPLLLPKTGGGFWSYPLTAAEYSGLYQTDLAAYFGGVVTASALASEFNYSPVLSDMDISEAIPGGYIYAGVTALMAQQDHYLALEGEYYCPNPVQAETIACMEARLLPWSSVNANTIAAATYPNAAGGVDTLSDDVAIQRDQLFDYPYQTGNFDGPGGNYVGWFIPPGYSYEMQTGSRATSFSAPVGGVPSVDYFLGYQPTAGTIVPPPALATAWKLTNAFGSVVVGAAISYVGTHTHSQLYRLEHFDYSDTETVCSFENIGAGAGSVTFLDGSVNNIAAEFAESGSVTNSDDTTFIWPTYNPVKAVDFAISDIWPAAGKDQGDDLKVVIILETQESGHIEVTMAPPPGPYTSYNSPVEGAPAVTGRVVDYYLAYVKCEVGEWSYDADPWTFAENEALKTEIYSAITAFRAANPLADPADRWVIRPEIQILKW